MFAISGYVVAATPSTGRITQAKTRRTRAPLSVTLPGSVPFNRLMTVLRSSSMKIQSPAPTTEPTTPQLHESSKRCGSKG